MSDSKEPGGSFLYVWTRTADRTYGNRNRRKQRTMKRIAILVLTLFLLIIYDSRKDMNISAEEAVMGDRLNPWENRPLIQTTSYEEEYRDAVKLGAFTMPLPDGREESLYEQASRCVVRITIGQYAGSGLIWRMEQDGMIIAANRHLLLHGAEAQVTLPSGIRMQAKTDYYSQEYDIGFLWIPREELTPQALADIYEIRAAKQNITQAGAQVMQIGSSEEAASDVYEGEIKGECFVPEFQAFMLAADCYSKAGMSGGGVFNHEGLLLGMITGGQTAQYDTVREAQLTYSITADIIEKEYQKYYRQ